MNVPALGEIFRSPERKTIAVVAAIAVVGVAYLFFAAVPQFLRVRSLSKEIAATSDGIKATESEIRQLAAYQKALEENRDQIAASEKRLLSQESDIPGLLETLSAMAKSTGVKIVGIRPVRPEGGFSGARGGGYLEAPILINAKSGYHELGDFVSRIESAEKCLTIADIDVASNPASPKKHDVTLLVMAYAVVK